MPQAHLKHFAACMALSSTLAFPAFAASTTPLDGFGDEFRTQIRDTSHFNKGKQAALFTQTDARGYGAELKGYITSNELAASRATRDFDKHENLTTLMVSGTYDLPARLDKTMPLHPFVTAGMGVAVYHGSEGANADGHEAPRGTALVPVFHAGAGLAYKMSEKMDLAVSYKTGVAAASGNERVNMQMVDVGMKLKF
jgi:opacity protein-like surface antigen